MEKIGEAIYYLLKRSSDEPGIKLGNLVRIITEFKTTHEVHLDRYGRGFMTEFEDVLKRQDTQIYYELTGFIPVPFPTTSDFYPPSCSYHTPMASPPNYKVPSPPYGIQVIEPLFQDVKPECFEYNESYMDIC